MKIFIDPGHGGHDSGAVGPRDSKEKDFNLTLSLKLGNLLKNNGHEIEYARKTDSFISLSKRSQLANEWGADLFISIHQNSANNSNVEGFEIFHHPNSISGKAHADNILQSVVKINNIINRGVKTANFSVLRKTKMPAILIECGFISNLKYVNWFNSSLNVDLLVRHIASPYLKIDTNSKKLVIEGRVKHFGGETDFFAKDDEPTALVYNKKTFDELKHYFRYYPTNEGFVKALDSENRCYISARWNYDIFPKEFLRSHKGLLINGERAAIVQPIEYGPSGSADYEMGVSLKALTTIRADKDDIVKFIFPFIV